MGKKVIHGGLILRATLASGSGHDLLTVNPSTGEITSISGTPLTTTLTSGQIIVGNSSDVATATAMSGDVTINSSGVTAIGAGVIVNADVNASAAIAHSKMAALTASRALVSDGSGVVSVSSVTSTELGYVSGVTSAIQTQINGKQATITGAATTITSSDLTANRALISGTLGKVEVSSVTTTELGYLSGVSSNIQTQFSGKLSVTIAGAAEGDILYYNGTNWVNLARGTNGQTLQSSATSIEWGTPTVNGIPIGGSDGQVLAKQSGTDFDADWETLTVSSITDLTASADELNLLDGVTATTTEINYLDGVTSNIQSQLGNKLSSTLAHNAMFIGNASNVASSLAAGSEGQVLTVTSGVPTWQTVSVSGVTTIAALDGTTKSANGAAISGVNLYLQTADATYPGLVSTGTQSFAGDKTFTGDVIVGNTTLSPSATGAIIVNDAVSSYARIGRVALGRSSTGFGVIGENFETTTSSNTYNYTTATYATQIDFTSGNMNFKTAPVGVVGAAISFTSALFIENGTGDIGIGTTSPSYPLDVQRGSGNTVARYLNSGTGTVNLLLSRTGGTASEWQLYLPSGSNELRYWNGSADVFYMTNSGRFGVGVSPTAKLHLPAGTATASTAPLKLTTGTALTTPEDGAMEYHSSNLYFTIGSTRYQLNGLIGSTGSTDNAILRADGTGGLTAQSSAVSIDDSGNVGLGLSGTVGSSRTISAVGSAVTVGLDIASKGGGAINIDAADGSTLGEVNLVAGTANVKITDANSAATNGLVVQHTLISGTPSAGIGTGISFYSQTGASNFETGASIEAVTTDVSAGSEDFDLVFKLMSGGSTRAEKLRLTSAGNMTLVGTGTGVDWVATSDRRLKSNIERVEDDVIEEIKKVGALFSKYERSGKTERGFIAQELLEVAPEYVTVPEDPEQMMAVNYAKMTALLFKGFQQLLNK